MLENSNEENTFLALIAVATPAPTDNRSSFPQQPRSGDRLGDDFPRFSVVSAATVPEEEFKVNDKYLICLFNILLENGNAPTRAPGLYLGMRFES